MAPPSDLRCPYKRAQLSDQQRRRELSLKRQEQSRGAELHACRLASTLLSLPLEQQPSEFESKPEPGSSSDYDLCDSSKLKGPEARKWFAKQLILPEWMIAVPHRLPHDRYVLPRPSGKRCFVVSSDGTTISRQRNGTIPSVLPRGSRNRDGSGSPSYSILDCIFHEMDQTYYVIDMVCWKSYSYYNLTAKFRFTWLESKLAETKACDPPSYYHKYYHKYRFSLVPWYDGDLSGLHKVYTGEVPFVKDDLLFYNRNAHYQPGNTPLALVWKDEHCSQYVIDTDNKEQVPSYQQVVLELQDDGKVTILDDPPVVFRCLNLEFIQQSELESGCLLRFTIGDEGLTIVDGKLERADLHYLGKSNPSPCICRYILQDYVSEYGSRISP